MARDVIIFFGEMGSGKSWCAGRYAQAHGYGFFEGDSVVTREMRACVGRFAPIPRHILSYFIGFLSGAITETARTCEADTLVVAQALYRDEDRAWLAEELRRRGFNVSFRWVRCPWHLNVRNLLTRPRGWRWVLYWLLNKPFFQRPTHPHWVWHNV